MTEQQEKQSAELVRIEGLSKYYRVRSRQTSFWRPRRSEQFRVLNDVHLDIYKGETIGLVGESGCGKTTLGRTLLRLTDMVEGKVYFDGHDIYNMDKEALRQLRRRMQMIFQDPYAALNNHMKVRDIIAEGVRINFRGTNEEVDERVRELLEQVNLQQGKINAYPHELSGGERRRVGIARILAVQPEFIIADEPVAALDVSIKAQIINLMQDLKEQYDLTFMFISHDIGMIKYVSDRIAVMYLGKIVEQGANRAIRPDRCLHPYTQQLLAAASYMSSNWEHGYSLESEKEVKVWDVPDEIPSGCPYHPRCALFRNKDQPDICRTQDPDLLQMGEQYGKPHWVACHFKDEIKALQVEED
jgi:oligopeptide/dipeptide ABC transporter ATP-binding protein